MAPYNLYIIVSSVFVVVISYDIVNWLKDRSIATPEIRQARLQSKINGTVLILGLTMVIASILFHVNLLRYSAPMPFSDIDQISLKDFKGFQRPFYNIDGQKPFAFITSTLSWKRDSENLEVQAMFHPSRSYVLNERTANRFVLRHELYHFRITEIFARKCRKELSSMETVPSDAIIRDVIAEHEEQENEMQRDYDHEGYHGYLMKEQKRWEKEIDSLLTLLDPYRNPTLVYE